MIEIASEDGTDEPSVLAVTSASVYWVTPFGQAGGARLLRAELDAGNGASGSDIATLGSGPPGALAYRDGFLYIGTSPQIARCADGRSDCSSFVDGGVELLTDRAGDVRAIAVDDDSIYWTSKSVGTAEGRVLKCPKTGCVTPVVVASGQQDPRGIAIDDSSVYWIDLRAADGSTNGYVLRTAK